MEGTCLLNCSGQHGGERALNWVQRPAEEGAGGVGEPGRGRQRTLGHWTVIPRACDETVGAEGWELAPSLQSRPALCSRRPRGGSVGWGAPSVRACDSCQGLEETCECNCVSAKPWPLPAGQPFWH